MQTQYSKIKLIFAVSALIALTIFGYGMVTGVFGGTRFAITLKSSENLKSGLVAHYTFDGPDLSLGSSTAEILDSSDNNNTGNWIDHATTTASGNIGQSIALDGTNDYVEVSDANSLDATNITISVWIKTDASGSYIISKEAP